MATKSNAFYIGAPLRASSDSWEQFTSTVDLTAVQLEVWFTDNTSARQYLSSTGSFHYSGSKYIKGLYFIVPRSHLPSSGTFTCRAACYCNAGASFTSAQMDAFATATGAASSTKNILDSSYFLFNYASWYLKPTNVDFRSFKSVYFRSLCENQAREVQGTFYLRYEPPTSVTDTPVDVGNTYDQGDLANQTAENTAQLVETQNETNGLLEDIIQHISDQLAALWDQLYNIAFVPWKNQQHEDSTAINDSIQEQIENDNDNTETVTDAIEQHGNFIIEGLKGLFIPSEDYFSTAVADLQTYFEDRLGALGYGFGWVIDLFTGMTNISSQNYAIRFPGITVPNRFTGEEYVILRARDVNIRTEMRRVTFGENIIEGQESANLFDLSRLVGNIMLTLGMVNLVIIKLKEIEEK